MHMVYGWVAAGTRGAGSSICQWRRRGTATPPRLARPHFHPCTHHEVSHLRFAPHPPPLAAAAACRAGRPPKGSPTCGGRLRRACALRLPSASETVSSSNPTDPPCCSLSLKRAVLWQRAHCHVSDIFLPCCFCPQQRLTFWFPIFTCRYLLTHLHPLLGGTVGMKGATVVEARLIPHDGLLPTSQVSAAALCPAKLGASVGLCGWHDGLLPTSQVCMLLLRLLCPKQLPDATGVCVPWLDRTAPCCPLLRLPLLRFRCLTLPSCSPLTHILLPSSRLPCGLSRWLWKSGSRRCCAALWACSERWSSECKTAS